VETLAHVVQDLPAGGDHALAVAGDGTVLLGRTPSPEGGAHPQVHLTSFSAQGDSLHGLVYSFQDGTRRAGPLLLAARGDGGGCLGFTCRDTSAPGAGLDVRLVTFDPGWNTPHAQRLDDGGDESLAALAGTGPDGTAGTGRSVIGGDTALLVLKLNGDGIVQWFARSPAEGSGLARWGRELVVLPGGGLRVLGGRRAPAPAGSDLLLCAFSATGSLAWSLPLHWGPGDRPGGLAADPGGTVALAGTVPYQPPRPVAALVDSAGGLLWSTEAPPPGSGETAAFWADSGLALSGPGRTLAYSPGGDLLHDAAVGAALLAARPDGGLLLAGDSLRRVHALGDGYWTLPLEGDPTFLAPTGDSTLVAVGHDSLAGQLHLLFLRESFSNRPPSPPALLAPADGAVLNPADSLALALRWRRGTDPDPGAVPLHRATIAAQRTGLPDTVVVAEAMPDSLLPLAELAALLGTPLEEIGLVSWTVAATSQGDTIPAGQTWSFQLGEGDGVAEEPPLPGRLRLAGLWPNPTNGAVSLAVHAPAGPLRLRLVDLTGRTVLERSWEGGAARPRLLHLALPLASGSYLLELEGGGGDRIHRRLVLLR
jgi:hypothetical protein